MSRFEGPASATTLVEAKSGIAELSGDSRGGDGRVSRGGSRSSSDNFSTLILSGNFLDFSAKAEVAFSS